MTRVGFLFNHDAAHQVMHAAPAAFEMAYRYPAIDVHILVTTEAEADAVAELAKTYPDELLPIERMEPPPAAHRLDRLTGNAFLLKRLGVLRRYRRHLAGFDMLVVPDKTSLFLKRWLGADCPRLVHAFHGAGDRAGGFQGVEKFDFCLLPGRKYESRLLAEGRIREHDYAVVGYSKLERCATLRAPRFFSDDRPTVLYTPHFDTFLSSWYEWGPHILESFAASDHFNLIFAPHVLLFRRRWHLSTEGGRPKRTPKIPKLACSAPNILIDTGSQASVDMTYTRAADLYLGDMSSQVYEFLYHPRPCIFLNRQSIDWQGDPDFRCWHTGDVIDRLEDLPDALERAVAEPQRYRVEQETAFSEAFDLSETPSAVRAADALAAYLGSGASCPVVEGTEQDVAFSRSSYPDVTPRRR